MAAAAGVSKPVLYAEFGDKVGIGEAIAVELGERGERVVIEEIEPGGRSRASARAISVAINRFIDIVIDEPEIYAFILRSIRTSDKGLLDNALIRTLEGRFQLLAERARSRRPIPTSCTSWPPAPSASSWRRWSRGGRRDDRARGAGRASSPRCWWPASPPPAAASG